MATVEEHRRWSNVGPDVVTAVGLVVAGWWWRRRALPPNGLLFDDAWVVAGARWSSLRQLLVVCTNHPGFTLLLKGWLRWVSSASESATWPVLVAGSLGGAVVYVVARGLSVRRPAALVAGALVVVSPAHIAYSGRVKPYVFETALIAVLAYVVPTLARRRWGTWTAISWVVATLAIGSLSVFLAVAAGIAGLVLVVAAHGDRPRRLVAVGVQGVIQASTLFVMSSHYNAAQVARDWDTTYDGYPELAGPVGRLARDLGLHLGRGGGEVLSVGPMIGLAFLAIAVFGLGWESWRGQRRLAARYLSILLALGWVGSLVNQVPFGPKVGNVVFPGGRAMLWLYPSLVLGVGFAVEAGLAALSRRVDFYRVGVALTLAGVVAIGAFRWNPRPSYLPTGARTASDAAQSWTSNGGKVILLNNPMALAAEPSSRAWVQADTHSELGFVVRFPRSRTWDLTSRRWNGQVDSVRRELAGQDRVVVLDLFIGFGDAQGAPLNAALQRLGFTKSHQQVVSGISAAQLWTR